MKHINRAIEIIRGREQRIITQNNSKYTQAELLVCSLSLDIDLWYGDEQYLKVWFGTGPRYKSSSSTFVGSGPVNKQGDCNWEPYIVGWTEEEKKEWFDSVLPRTKQLSLKMAHALVIDFAVRMARRLENGSLPFPYILLTKNEAASAKVSRR